MKRIFILILTIFVFLPCLAACSEEDPTRACVFIVGNHANANYIGDIPDNDTYKKAVNMIESCVQVTMDHPANTETDTYAVVADIDIIICDGNPERVDLRAHQMNFYIADASTSENEAMDEISELTNRIMSFMFSEELRADDEEVDLLAAIAEAEKILAHSDAGKKHIFIIDTGITTAGYLNMTLTENNITKTDFRTVYQSLPDGAFADLSDIEVTFEGLGNVAGIQDDMRSDNAFVNNLRGLWTMILKERMKADITNDEILYAYREGTPMMYTEDENLYPYVSKVYFRGDMPEIEPSEWPGYPEPETEPPETEPPETESTKPEPPKTEPEKTEPPVAPEPPVIILAHQELGFEADAATFRDGSKQATYAIEEYKDDIVDFLTADPTNNKLYIVGSIANTRKNLKSRTADLAQARAEAVAKLLYERNVREDQIIIINAGTTEFTWRDTDEFVNGEWNNQLAESNRIVAIIGSTSKEQVAELRREGYID